MLKWFRHPPFGFRLSGVDLVVLTVCILLTVYLWEPTFGMIVLLPMIVGHFFLFCNVFRLRRSYELFWAACFIINAVSWTAEKNFNWVGILLVQLPITMILVGMEMRGPRYHGIFARGINPRLDEYLRAREEWLKQTNRVVDSKNS